MGKYSRVLNTKERISVFLDPKMKKGCLDAAASSEAERNRRLTRDPYYIVE